MPRRSPVNRPPLPQVTVRDRQRRNSLVVWTQALATTGAFVGATLMLEPKLPHYVMESQMLRLAVAFTLTQLLVIDAVVVVLLLSKLGAQLQQRRFQRIAPTIRRALVDHALDLGHSRERDTEGLRRRHPRIFERCIIDLFRSLEGPPRHRLSQLAEHLGVFDEWLRHVQSPRAARRVEAVRALGFAFTPNARQALVQATSAHDPDTQQAAVHALLRQGDAEIMEWVFEYAVDQPLWHRAVLGASLANHADVLSQRAIPRALRRTDSTRLECVLELVQGWHVRLAFDTITPLLESPLPQIRARAYRLIPNVVDGTDLAAIVKRGLRNNSDDVRAAAAYSAQQLKLTSVAADLVDCVAGHGEQSPRAAAMALAALGSSGMGLLETLAHGESAAVAHSATEVMEKARIGRLQLLAVG